jgi:hypothetical protein
MGTIQDIVCIAVLVDLLNAIEKYVEMMSVLFKITHFYF